MPPCMRRLLAGLLLAVLAAMPLAASADTGRIALVIGNGKYGEPLGQLRNPANDAKLMARTLKQLGFDVTLALDIDQKQMKRHIRDFGSAITAAGPESIGLFYFAGHGLQVDGENYLLPVGANIESEGDVELEAVSANTVLAQMQYAHNNINLIFLDACRNNPLARGFRSATRGLARVDAPRGSFVGYSTAPGDVSLDGDGKNSPYAIALADELLKPGEAIEEVHRAVRLRVLEATQEKQTPWDSSSLTASVTLAGAAAPQVAAVAPTPAPVAPVAPAASSDMTPLQKADLAYWQSIQDSDDPALYADYLKQFPRGMYVEPARSKISKLTGLTQSTQVQQVASATPASTPDPQPITTASAAPSADEIVPMEGAYVATRNANIRAKPDTGAPILGKVKAAENVTVIGRSADAAWLQVATADGTGYVSAKLLKADPAATARTPQPAPAPAPEPVAAPEPENVLRIAAEFRPDIEKFLSNSKSQTGKYRYLAVNATGDAIGLSTGCNIKKWGWGGYAVDGCGDAAAAQQIALDDCGANCKVIFNGTEKIGDFEIAWVESDGSVEAADLPAETETVEPAAVEPVETAVAVPTAGAPGEGGIVRIAESLRADVEKFLSNSKSQTGKYRFLAVNAAGDKIGLSTGCNIKKWGWGGYAVDGCGEEAAAKQIAIEDCGRGCTVIFNGTQKIGDFEIEWY